MTSIWLYSLVSVFVVSLISLIGIFTLSIAVEKLRWALFLLVSFSAGALMGDAFIHLLPELADGSGFGVEASLFVLTGIAFFFIVEKFIHWRHCHHAAPGDHVRPFAITNLVGDAIHNMVDGVVIGASYLVSIPVGIATTIAVVLHEIPQEVSDFGVLLQGGYSKKRALWLNFLVATGSIAGVLLALIIGEYAEDLRASLLAFSAGAFIYIAGADLIPELHKELNVRKSIGQFIVFVLGIVVMLAMLLFE